MSFVVMKIPLFFTFTFIQGRKFTFSDSTVTIMLVSSQTLFTLVCFHTLHDYQTNFHDFDPV